MRTLPLLSKTKAASRQVAGTGTDEAEEGKRARQRWIAMTLIPAVWVLCVAALVLAPTYVIGRPGLAVWIASLLVVPVSHPIVQVVRYQRARAKGAGAKEARAKARPLLPAALQAKIPRVHVPIGKWPTQTHARKILMLNNCVQEGMLPAVDKATARVLDRLGIQAIIERKSGCCGSLPYHMDDEAGGLADVRRNIDAWWPHIEQGLEAIVINISGCSAMVKDYGYLMRLDPAYAEKAARISAMTFDLSEWLARELGSRRPKTALPAQRLVFHPPCTLQHAQKIRGVVEAMLTTWGAELQPIQESHLCCGSAGAYSVLQPELSQKLRSRKLSNLERHQPEVILSANVGCIGHLGGGTQTPVMHWIEWMEQRLLAGGVTDERIEMPEMAPDTHEEGASVRNTLKATAITRPGREAAAEKKAEKKAAEAA